MGGKCGKRVIKQVGNSIIATDVMLYDYIDRIDFEAAADGKTPHLLLRVEFPLDINAQCATCDVQFGNVSRSTTTNTTWEQAKFEFCAHKYVDISDGNFGVALLNDCKYGYSAQDNVLSLTLIKCSRRQTTVWTCVSINLSMLCVRITDAYKTAMCTNMLAC